MDTIDRLVSTIRSHDYYRATLAITFLKFAVRPRNWLAVPWLLIVLLVVTGYCWAKASSDWQDFSRMGSAIVVVSVLTYSGPIERELSQLCERLKSNFEQMAFASMGSSIHMNQSGRSDRNDKQKQGLIMGRAINDFGVLVANLDIEGLERLIARNALIMAIFGTIVWGFGDLLGRFSS